MAHPGLVPVAKEIFDAHMRGPNQICSVTRADVHVTAADLLRRAGGRDHRGRAADATSTSASSTWRPGCGGNGCVPIYNLMEDAATAEISRTQVWQWVTHGAKLADGRRITADLVRRTMAHELGAMREQLGPTRYDSGKFDLASKLFDQMMTGTDFPEFLTTVAYDYLD